MDSKYFAYNQTRGCFLSGSLTFVDAGLEPLRVLKVLIEGLEPGAKSGLWLAHFRSVPVARTLSPFDLVYLDSEFRVVHAVELSTDGEFAPFRGQPSSALILPFQSIVSTQTQPGDQLVVRVAEEPGVASSNQRATPSAQRLTITAAEPRPVTPGAHYRAASNDRNSSPLDQFLAQQSAISTGRGRGLQNAKSLLALSAERAPVPTVQSPLAQSMAAFAEPAVESRPSIHAVPSSAPQAGEPRSGPTRTSRIAPPAAAAPPQRPDHKTSSNVTEFPHRDLDPSAATDVEGKDLPSEIESPSTLPREKLPLLMKILRLQFIRRAHDSHQAFDLDSPAPDAPDAPIKRGRAIPDRAMRFLRWLYPELEITTAAELAVRPSYNAKTKFQHEVTPTGDLRLFKWIYPELTFLDPHKEADTGPLDRRVSARIPQPGLVAYYFTGGPPKAQNIDNISVTGFFMRTDERWMPGTIIRMTLQLIGTSGEGPSDTLTVHSRVVRWGANGEAFEFVLAGFLDERLPISYGRPQRFPYRLKT